MFSRRKPPAPAPELVPPLVDQQTGEVLTGKLSLPDPTRARKLSNVAGELPPVYNLRDHPEFDGQDILIVGVRLSQGGEFGDYVKIACYPLEDGKPTRPVVIMTGSANVVDRAMTIAEEVSSDNPIIGKLRSAGRAWLLE